MGIWEQLGEIAPAVGKPVTIRGRVVITGDDRAFLTSGDGPLERREALPIRDGSRIAEHLSQTLASYVGGPFIYDDECVITGTIEQGPGSFQLCDIRQFRVWRDDFEVEVPVDLSPPG